MDTAETALLLETAAPAVAPRLSLLLCTVGRSAQLERCLVSLVEQEPRGFELVLVDQNEPGVLDAVLAPFRDRLDIRHVYAPRGLSKARNVGLALCRGMVIGLPDDDCWYPPGLVGRIDDLFAGNPLTDIFSGRTVDAQGHDSLGKFLSVDGAIDKHNVWFAGNSNAIFVRRAAALRVNGFDETLGVGAATPFQSGEETDFVLRILAGSGCGVYRRDIVVHHDQTAAGAPAAAVRRAAAYSRGFGRVLRLHDYGWLYLAQRLARTLASGMLAAVRGDFGQARVKFVWAAGTVRGFLSRR